MCSTKPAESIETPLRSSPDCGVPKPMKSDDAIRDVYATLYLELLRFVRKRLPSECEAADLTQESFVHWLKFTRETGKLVHQPRAFLFRVARNLTHDYWRGQSPLHAGFAPNHGGT